MKEIEFEQLIKYHEGKLSKEARTEIEKFIHDRPYYLEVLSGISKVEEELKEGEHLKGYFEQKRLELKKRIFRE